MNLIGWLSVLAPSLQKVDVLADVEKTEKKLRISLIPVYDEFAKSFLSTRQLRSKELSSFEKTFYSESKLKDRGYKNFLACVQDKLPNVLSNLKEVHTQIEALMDKDIYKSGLTCKQSLIIRSAEQIGFITNYAMDLITYVYSVEAIESLGKKASTGDVDIEKLPKIQLEFIENNFFKFSAYFGMYSVPVDQFKVRIGKSPEVNISTDERVISRLTSLWDIGDIDAISKGSSVILSKFEFNPFYHFGKMIAQWQNDRYNLYKEKREAVQMRLLHLITLDEGKNDPKQQQEIEYLNKRIDDLSHKIKAYEESIEDGND